MLPKKPPKANLLILSLLSPVGTGARFHEFSANMLHARTATNKVGLLAGGSELAIESCSTYQLAEWSNLTATTSNAEKLKYRGTVPHPAVKSFNVIIVFKIINHSLDVIINACIDRPLPNTTL